MVVAQLLGKSIRTTEDSGSNSAVGILVEDILTVNWIEKTKEKRETDDGSFTYHLTFWYEAWYRIDCPLPCNVDNDLDTGAKT